MNPDNYLYLSALLFTIGASGVLLRRNAIVMFMCVELMLNAANVSLVAFDAYWEDVLRTGQSLAIFVITIAAAEIGLGLAIVLMLYRARTTIAIDDATELRELRELREPTRPGRADRDRSGR